jgi:hypothetical protein
VNKPVSVCNHGVLASAKKEKSMPNCTCQFAKTNGCICFATWHVCDCNLVPLWFATWHVSLQKTMVCICLQHGVCVIATCFLCGLQRGMCVLASEKIKKCLITLLCKLNTKKPLVTTS